MGSGNIRAASQLAEKKAPVFCAGFVARQAAGCQVNARSMRFPGLVLVAMVMALSLAGCMQMEKIVKVNADGSGTIEETVVRNKEMADSFAQISAQSKGAK